MKNKQDLDFVLTEKLTPLIDDYIMNFRPILLRVSNSPLLFPGQNGKEKTKATLSEQITERIEKALGFRITCINFGMPQPLSTRMTTPVITKLCAAFSRTSRPRSIFIVDSRPRRQASGLAR